MTFDEIFDQIITLLKTQSRVSYGAIKRRFDLDDDYLDDLKTEIIAAQQLAVDENGRIMLWVADTASTQGQDQAEPTQTQQPAMQDDRTPQTEPLSEPPTLDAERRQLTVMFWTSPIPPNSLANSIPRTCVMLSAPTSPPVTR